MTRSDGTPTAAVYVFTQLLWNLVKETNADHIAVIFDTARKTFRSDIYPEYKAHRPEPPEDLIPQFPLLREAVKAMNVACTELPGYEADDLIATYARLAVEAGAEVTIVSADKDLMQLVGPKVKLLEPINGTEIGSDGVFKRFGVYPDRVVDVQAIAGDSIDNVPGVKGIGEGPAAQLVTEFGSLEGVLDAVRDPEAVKKLAAERCAAVEKQIYELVGHPFKISSPKQLCEVLVNELNIPVPKDKKTGNYSTNADSLDSLAAQGFEIAKLIAKFRFYGKLGSSYADILAASAENARMSLELVTLCKTAPVPEPLTAFAKRQIDPETFLSFLRTQEFKSLVNRFGPRLGVDASKTPTTTIDVAAQEQPAAPAVGSEITTTVSTTVVTKTITTTTPADVPTAVSFDKYELVQDEVRLAAWIAEAREAGRIAFDTETTSLDPMRADLVGMSLGLGGGRACYVPLAHRAGAAQGALDLGGGDASASGNNEIRQIKRERAIELIKPLLEDATVLKIGQNIKFDMQVLARYGVEIAPIDDTMIMSYVLEGGAHGHGMDELSELHLGHTTIKFKDVCGTGKNQITFDLVALDKARDYAAEDADVTRRLYDVFKPRMVEDHMVSVYETLERPLINVLSDMEETGIKVDAALLRELSEDFAHRCAELEGGIHKLVGREFNVGSPKQLGEVLFDEMGLPGGKKGKTGAYATGADVLEDLAAQGHELPARILDWRQLSKLKSTYTDTLIEQIDPRTGRVHTCYSQAIASTGRLSSNDPNLQNIPIRTDEGRKIRRAFVPEPGHVLMSADYSQIELRLLAHVAKIDPLIKAFHDGADIHAMTASQVFGVPVEGMDPMVRRQAKAINFGIIYGISAFGLARQLGIARGEAQAYIDAYFKKYPGIRTYMDATKELARRQGYVSTLYGRKCHVTGINDKNPAMRSFAERAAINAPIQGGAADIIKRAMIRMPGALQKAGLKSRMLLQVHDELVFEVPEAEIETTQKLARSVMEQVAHLDVPLVVDTGVGKNWDEAH